jgi:hypothetical protein
MDVKMQTIQFGSIVNVIQMKLTKVIDSLKNTPNKGFQHSVQSKLIKVMTLERQMTQFVSIGNFFQLKLCNLGADFRNAVVAELNSMEESKSGQEKPVRLAKMTATPRYLPLNLPPQQADAHKTRFFVP